MKRKSVLGVVSCLCIGFGGSAAALNAAAGDVTVTSGPFRAATSIPSQLKRGVSTREDVHRLLGKPNGTGGMISASFGNANQEIWYYENIEITGSQSAKDAVNVNMRQQIMLVFFKGERFDGYLWTTNAGTGAVR